MTEHSSPFLNTFYLRVLSVVHDGLSQSYEEAQAY